MLCGRESPLEIDHVFGGGKADFKTRGAHGIYRDIRDGRRPGEFQVLCRPCNQLKNGLPDATDVSSMRVALDSLLERITSYADNQPRV